MSTRRTGWWRAAAVLCVLAFVPALLAAPPVAAQEGGMEQRVQQVLGVIEAQRCPAVKEALVLLPEVLWGGMRPLVSKGLEKETKAAHAAATGMEQRAAGVLDGFVAAGECGAELVERALDLKLFIEQVSEVAAAVSAVTARCGDGDSLREPPCDELAAVLDETTGHELPAGQVGQRPGPTGRETAAETDALRPVFVIRPPYSVKLRGPVVPPWIRHVEEDVRVTDPIAPGECVVVFKEFKGLMARLKFDRIIVVSDPWVTFYGVPRGTRVPIWRLEWIFSEYVKEWNICNHDGRVRKTVTQRVKQDLPLNYFWRYYHKDP